MCTHLKTAFVSDNVEGKFVKRDVRCPECSYDLCLHLHIGIVHGIIGGEWVKKRQCLDCDHEELVGATMSRLIKR